MAQIRVRFEINRGGEGAPLDKLADIAREAERFLRMLADDLQIENRKGEWLAVRFDEGGSVRFDAMFAGAPSDREASTYSAALETVTAYDPDADARHPSVSDATLIQFSRLGQNILPHERIGIGLYDGADEPREWRGISYERANKIRKYLEAPIASYGSVQGLIHALYKEADRPYFQLRELSTSDLIRCEYTQDMYDEVVDALRDRRMTVHVAGPLKLDRATRGVVEVRVQRILAVEPMSNDEFEKFFGSAPDFTGAMTTEDYIERVRGYEN